VILTYDKTGKVTGFAHFEDATRHAPSDWRSEGVSLHDLRTANTARGTGVGSALIEAMRKRHPHHPLKVYNALDSARSFYEKTGADFGHGQSHLGTWKPHAERARKAS
jgi:GNAT superfamily N-acetyltransferase